MKTIIILGALVISAGAFAQGKIEKVEQQITVPRAEVKQTAEKLQKDVDSKLGETKADLNKLGKDQVDSKIQGAKGAMEDNVDMEMIDKKINQGKAAEAKMKAAQVTSKAEAEEMISTSKAETKETMNSIGSKIDNARAKLTEKLATGELTKEQVTEKLAKLNELEDRRKAIMSEMK